MLLNILNYIVGNLVFFTGAYSNNVFPEQLPQDLELEYIKKSKSGDKEARNKLIEHNLRLVAHIAKKFEATGHDVDDLIGIGTVGLIKGIDTYSENKKVKLSYKQLHKTRGIKCRVPEYNIGFKSLADKLEGWVEKFKLED